METVQINRISPDPKQPRKIFSQSHIKGLAKNLKIEGMINPIEVDKNYQIITGECRWRAAKEAGWTEVPVNINKKGLSDYERFRRQMAENLHQSAAGGSTPMNAIDVARGYKQMIKLRLGKDYVPGTLSRQETYGLIGPIATELAVNEHTVWEYLTMLSEPKYVLEDIAKGRARTIYREIEGVPEKYKEPLKQAVSEGKIKNREDISRFKRTALMKPEKAEIEFMRITQQQNEQANRILNRAVELGLALKNCDPSKFSLEDKKMIRLQLNSVTGSIRAFIGKLKNDRPNHQA